MEKVIRDGKVAVLVSPGFGAGWSTWQGYECLFTPEVVEWVLAGKPRDAQPDWENLYDEEFYAGGAEDLYIVWVPIGRKFRVTEYDGAENLEYEDEIHWSIA